MRNYSRNNAFRGGGRDNRGGGDRQMHRATCDDCGKSCEVPFRPTGDKPIYCSNCFQGDRNPRGGDRGRDNRGGGRDNRGGGRDNRGGGDRQMHRVTCDDCGKSCEVPFRPSGDKPVYCSNCFDKGGNANQGRSDKSGKKHDEMSKKLDKIISLLEKLVPAEKIPKEVKEEKPKKEKAPAKKAAVKKTATKKKATKKATTKKAAVKKKAPAKKTVKKKAATKKKAK